MSASNGDRSRHHRLRKAKERRRVALRALRADMKSSTSAAAEASPKSGADKA